MVIKTKCCITWYRCSDAYDKNGKLNTTVGHHGNVWLVCSSTVPNFILSLGYCLGGISMHGFLMSMWVT